MRRLELFAASVLLALCPVLQAEEPARSFRLGLVAAAQQALANSLALLGIEAPEVM